MRYLCKREKGVDGLVMGDAAYNKAAVQYAEEYLDQLLRRTDFAERAGVSAGKPPPKAGARRRRQKKKK